MFPFGRFSVTAALLLALVSCQSAPPPPPAPKKESLLDLVENQNLDRIREIFGFNTDPNSVNDQGQTALHVTALKNLPDIASVLLVRGAQINAQDRDGNTPLHLALEQKALPVVELLVRYKASLFLKNIAGRHPLHLAQDQGLDTLKVLVRNENVNTPDENGHTPLHFAASAGLAEAEEYYLTQGGDPRVRNAQKETPLDVALKFPRSLAHARVAKALLMQGSPQPSDPQFDYLGAVYPAGQVNSVLDQGSTALHLAASRNHLGVVQLLLAEGAAVDPRDFPGNTPLHKALEKAHLEVAKALLAARADITIRDFNSNSALHLALTSPLPDQACELVLSKGLNPDFKNNYGNTALHLAVTLDLPLTVIDLLLKKGADPNPRNKDGNTPLLEAVQKNQKEAALVLLKSGASLFAANNSEESPLSAAIRQGNQTLAWVITPANVNTRDDNGNTPLHRAVTMGEFPEAVGYLISQGAKVSERNKNGSTPLHEAIRQGSVLITKLLLSYKADWFIQDNQTDTPLTLLFRQPLEIVDQVMISEYLEMTDNTGSTPLFFAIATGNAGITANLLGKGANLGAKNISGSTPLHEAVRFGQKEIIQILLKAGARVNEGDNLGNTPLHNLVLWYNPQIADLLLAGGAALDARNLEGRTPLAEAVRKGDSLQVRYFLGKKASLTVRDNLGRTPLFDAVLRDNRDIVQLLLDAGILTTVRDNTGSTPLHLAVTRPKTEVIQALLASGADLFAQNQQGQTPISLALKTGESSVRALLSPRTVNLQSNDGNSPLHIAVQEAAAPALLEILLSLGADVNNRNKNGKTPLALALEAKNTVLSEVIMKAGGTR